jgi:hypothetical protein
MVKRTATTDAREIKAPTNSFPDHASANQSTQANRSSSDEIIVSLANAYENKRARQVGEWERTQTLRMSRAA